MTRIKIFDIPRARDEQILRWLSLRQAGWSSQQIAHREGVMSATVRSQTNQIRKADLMESGEDPAEVQEAYA